MNINAIVVDHEIHMLQSQLIHLLSLGILLTPGIVAGLIVTWKTRSPWALFITIASSLFGSFAVTFVAMVLGGILLPLLSTWLGSWSWVIDFFQVNKAQRANYEIEVYFRNSITLSIGLFTGAFLSGMLLMARHKIVKSGGKFKRFYTVASGIGASIIGGVLSIPSLLVFVWLGTAGIEKFLSLFGSEMSMGVGWLICAAYLLWAVSLLINVFICGLFSAVGGVKIAKIFM